MLFGSPSLLLIGAVLLRDDVEREASNRRILLTKQDPSTIIVKDRLCLAKLTPGGLAVLPSRIRGSVLVAVTSALRAF